MWKGKKASKAERQAAMARALVSAADFQTYLLVLNYCCMLLYLHSVTPTGRTYYMVFVLDCMRFSQVLINWQMSGFSYVFF